MVKDYDDRASLAVAMVCIEMSIHHATKRTQEGRKMSAAKINRRLQQAMFHIREAMNEKETT